MKEEFELRLFNTNGVMKYENNQCVEGYAYFLSKNAVQVSRHTIAPFTLSLRKTIRLALDGYLAFNKSLRFDVVSINWLQNDVSRATYYYYVDSFAWKANGVLEINMTLDVLNTYSGDPSTTSNYLLHYLSKKTMIQREHKSRFAYWGYADSILTLKRQVDKIPEGFGDCTKYQVSSVSVLDSRFQSADSQPWSVYYGKTKDGDGSEYVLAFNPSRTAVTVKNGSSSLYINRASVFATNYSGATKIIEYPYLPFFNVSHDSGSSIYTITHPSGTSVLYYNNEHSSTTTAPYSFILENAHSFAIGLSTANYGVLRQSYVEIGTRTFSQFLLTFTTPTKTDKREILDSKVYHSDFYAPQFIYGDSSFLCQFEKITPTSSLTATPAFTIGFAASTSPVSTFGFKFFPTSMTYKTSSSYETIMMITRNNEKTLYTDDYLNYLRTGYNYSLASKATNAVSSLINTGAMGAIGATTGNVGMEVGAVSSLVNVATSMLQGYISEENKKAQLGARAIGANGSDSLEVFSALCENTLKYEIYQVSSEIRGMLDDFFYYYGYKCGYQEKPDIDSRYWFNFLQCTPKWETGSMAYSAVDKDHLKAFENKLQEGITIYHNNDGTWDIAQEMENWESDIAKLL